MTAKVWQMAKQLTPSMREIIDYFAELGPRWGLEPNTCAVHALLYLTRSKLSHEEIADYLELDAATSKAAMDDLVEWRMAELSDDGCVYTDGEPWDLLSAGLEERRRREIGPALAAIGGAAATSATDGTPRMTAVRIHQLHELLQDLSAISGRMDKLPSNTMKHAIRLGGQMSKLFSGK